MIDWSKVELDSFYELFKITYLTQAWYYTNADHAITYDGHVYLPAAIKHEEVIKNDELNKQQLNLTFPISEFAKKYISTAPVYDTFVTIYMYFDALNVLIAFQGKIATITLSENNTCTVVLDEHTELSVKLPRTLIQPACNHILFDSNCTLVKASWKVPAAIDEITGPTEIICNSLSSYADDYFTQGVVEFEGDLRYIVGHWGGRIALQFLFNDLEVGDTLNFYPGCDKAPETCKNKFNNLTHYLGCPYVPRKNPVLFGI